MNVLCIVKEVLTEHLMTNMKKIRISFRSTDFFFSIFFHQVLTFHDEILNDRLSWNYPCFYNGHYKADDYIPCHSYCDRWNSYDDKSVFPSEYIYDEATAQHTYGNNNDCSSYEDNNTNPHTYNTKWNRQHNKECHNEQQHQPHLTIQ